MLTIGEPRVFRTVRYWPISCGELSVQVLVVDLVWGLVGECRVESFGIVSEFDVPGNIVDGVAAGRVLGAVDPLVLQGGEERFGHRIIVAYPGAPDGMPEVIFPQRPGELLGRVVAAAVGVENGILGERIIAGGHLYGLLDERRLVVVVCRPADHFLRVAVDNRRQVKPNGLALSDHFMM